MNKRLAEGSVLCAASFLACFDNRAGYWTYETLRAAVTDVLGPEVVDGSQRWVWAAGGRPEYTVANHAGDSVPTVALLPVHTGTEGFQKWVAPMLDRVVFLRGRVREPGMSKSPPYDSMLVLVVPKFDPMAELVGGKQWTGKAVAGLMDHGQREVVVTVDCRELSLTVHLPELADAVATGQPYSLTLRPPALP